MTYNETLLHSPDKAKRRSDMVHSTRGSDPSPTKERDDVTVNGL